MLAVEGYTVNVAKSSFHVETLRVDLAIYPLFLERASEYLDSIGDFVRSEGCLNDILRPVGPNPMMYTAREEITLGDLGMA